MSEAPIRIAHPDRRLEGDLCGCCEGTALSTLQPIWNRPNLTAITYRVGEHARFKASMLTALASADHAALGNLGTRDDDDFSIALIDGWATVLDVLSFYQERHANEAFMQTALERLSIGEIARLIGYRLHPGSAAETDLVFLMDDPPGAEPTVADLDIPEGTRVQSQPGPDEVPQVFETIEPLSARVAWNSLRPRQSRMIAPKKGDIGTWLQGQATGLRPGDAVLIVGRQRGDPTAPDFDAGSELWDFRRIVRVVPDPDLDRTWIAWDRGLGSINPPGEPAQADHRLYALRDQASLFGYNAPHPRVLSSEQRTTFGYVPSDPETIADPSVEPSPSLIKGDDTHPGDWLFKLPGTGQIALDSVYKSFVEDGWVVLTLPDGLVELYSITDAKADAEARYAISAKTTRLSLDTTEGLGSFVADYRRVAVYGGSEELALATTPLRNRVSGIEIELDIRADELPEGRRLILSGPRAQGLLAVPELDLEDADGATRTLAKGARLTLLTEPEPVPGKLGTVLWTLADADGFAGTVEAADDALQPVAADETAELIAEIAELDRVDAADPTHSILVLSSALTNAFDRAGLKIHGNIARASHGESTSEILGGGDPSRPFQSAKLKQNPVTHLVAATENGVASTLGVRVDGVSWTEVPDLYARGPSDRIFATSLTDDGETVIRFGDGRSGARPPAGRDNMVAEYRRGLGRAGNVRAGQLALPLDRPLGLRDVVNPLAATGGDDPEVAADARRNAPIYTLTLGRVVSITDYRDFALGYPGIAKADARWVWDGEARRIVVTVAGPDGAVLAADGPTYPALLDAFRAFGDPFVRFDLISYAPVHFRIKLRVAVDPAYETETVFGDVEAALRTEYAFDARGFAQPVALSGIVATVHRVDGVRAVDIDRLYRDTGPQTAPKPHDLLIARPGRLAADGTLAPAEILTISPEPFDGIEVMS
jgi:hypothetical protein